MTKQIMDIDTLSEYIANTFGTTKVLVQKSNCILTIEPILPAKSDATIGMQELFVKHPEVSINKNLESISVDKTKAGTLTLDDFAGVKLFTKGFKFNRDEANERS
jgi:hypothetical protein